MVHICILSIIAIICTVIISFIINNFNDKIIKLKDLYNRLSDREIEDVVMLSKNIKESNQDNLQLINRIIQSEKDIKTICSTVNHNDDVTKELAEKIKNNKEYIAKIAESSLDLAKIVEKQGKVYDKDKICLSGLMLISGKRFSKIEERLDLIENKIIKDNKTKSNKSNNKTKKE